ncbi:hypothetical protein VTO42DRAFT_4731 [Malbranchea cinnamomea]
MNVVASPPQSPRMSRRNNVPYRVVVPQRQASPVRPTVTDQPGSPSTPNSPRSPRSPRSFAFPTEPYASSPGPEIYSPTATNFTAILAKHGHLPPEFRPSVFSGRLPAEVYDCILLHLEQLHTAPHQEGCTTCYMRDLYSLTLTSRAWERAARSKLYNKINLHGADSPAQLKKYKWKRGSRLKLLRRTLRERKSLANLVLELRVPQVDIPVVPGKQNNVLQEYRDLVASVVMVCPNLERLLGLTLPYTHEFDRLTYALSTRKKLKEHAWIIGDNAEVAERAKQRSTDILDQVQVYQFLSYHVSWSNLETLMLHSLDSKGMLDHGVFLRMFNFLPSLRHLSVSYFDASDFTDRTLLFLPPLLSLRLEGLRGVTENGLARFASRPEARSLTSLTLIEQNITSLHIISKLFSSLRNLEKFSISQANTSPTLPEDGMIFQPFLASSTLKYLHWDVASPDPANALSQLDSATVSRASKNNNTPNAHLAQSILHDGFPSLRWLRAPLDIDPLGALQAVCRPARNAQIMIPQDRYSLPRSSHGSTSKRPLAMPGGNNLTSARIRAQTLIDMAPRDGEPIMKVVITDHSDMLPVSTPSAFSDSSSEHEVEDTFQLDSKNMQRMGPQSPVANRSTGVKVDEYTFPAFMGRVCNHLSNDQTTAPVPPRFRLLPDIHNSDADGGLISWRHFLAANQTYVFMPPSPLSSTPSAGRANTISSISDDLSSPSPSTATSTSSRFSLWGSNSSTTSTNSPVPPVPSPRTPTSPSVGTMISPFPSAHPQDHQPFWTRDTCNGSWNRNHPRGKDWWMHVERERMGGPNSASMVTLDRLF